MALYRDSQEHRLEVTTDKLKKISITLDCFDGTRAKASFSNIGLKTIGSGDSGILGKEGLLREKSRVIYVSANNPSSENNRWKLTLTADSGNSKAYQFSSDYNGTPSYSGTHKTITVRLVIKFI